jgi:hypothetical protein
LPGLFISGLTSMFVFGASMGVLWLFVFGDNPWPSSTDTVLVVVMVLIFLTMWIGLIMIGYSVGKKLEATPTLNKNHILLSGGITVLFILFFIFQQWNVGNLGPKSDELICSEYCAQQGYAGSGMPPRDSGDRTCSCYDSSGKEAIRIPVGEIDLDASK